MICSVLVSKTHEVNHKWNEGYNLIVPPGKADTTVSRDVYVKYNDFDFYPLNLVYYYQSSEDYDYYYDYDYYDYY